MSRRPFWQLPQFKRETIPAFPMKRATRKADRDSMRSAVPSAGSTISELGALSKGLPVERRVRQGYEVLV